MDNRPIGVFDSGLGGLTAVKELEKVLPQESLVYFGDTGRVPYGSRSRETVRRYAKQDMAFLMGHGVKAVLAACGTVSSTARDIGESLGVPYFDVVRPTAQAAAAATKNKKVGVIGTSATIHSGSYRAALLSIDYKLQVFSQPCPLFVPLVENAFISPQDEVTRLVAERYLAPLRESGVDTLILGCTHYPLIKSMIGEFMGRNVVLVDPAKTAAHHLERILSERGLKADHPAGQAHFYVSDAPDGFVQTADLFLGEYKGGEVEQIAIDKY